MLDFLASVARRIRGQDAIVGGLYSTDQFDGTFGVAKVLVTDRKGVHIRTFTDQFPSRPAPLTSDDLNVAIGHLPLTWRHWLAWHPALLSKESVEDEELVGYRIWLDDEADYFDLGWNQL